MNIFNSYNFLLLYNYNTVSGEVIATGHAKQVFNDLHYSNRCRFISIACIWPVAMASLPLNTVQCLIKIINRVLFQLLF
jgi:hypothetical protein